MNRFILILLFALPITISSFDNPIPVPDPEVFGKKIIELIKREDTTLYRNAFMVDREVYLSFTGDIANDPYSRIARKENFNEMVAQSTDKVTKEVSMFLSRNIKVMESWKEKEKIDVKKLEYLRTYYDYQYKQREGLFVIKNADILTKYDTTFYLIKFRELVFIRNNWYGGKLDEIVKLTPDFNESDISYSYYQLNGIPVEEDVVAVDTVAVAPPYEENRINKKKEKKRQRLYRKLEKLDY